jgi:predicted porin
MGELRIGRGLSLGHAAMASYDATGIANYSTVATTFGAIGGSRNDSEIRLTSKEIHPGLKLAVGYVFEADNKAAGDAKESKMDLAAMYANGPISASVVYSKPGKTEKSFALGGGYSFGQYKVMASYQDPAGMSKGFTVGGSADFGAATVAVDVARDTEAKATNLVVEGKYSLSKRTTTYAAYQRFGATSSNTVSAGLRHNF